jgi:uridine kinase
MAARPHLIGIAGPSCAGKSELARWLAARLQAPVLNLDHYYVDRRGLPIEERARRNFDEPAALDYPLILEHVQLLAAGKSVRAPRYDFATHTRARDEALVEPGDYMILEGLFALYWPAVRALMRTRLFVAAPDEVCLERRTARDVRERGRSPESVHWQFETTVRPMAHLHVLPTAAHAGLVLVGTEPIDSLGARVLAIL